MAPAKKRGKGSSAVAAAAEWKVGDLVLAKVKGFPAWPAQVSRAEEYGKQRNPARVFVVFFGTKQIRFCHHSEISAFTVEARAALNTRILSKCVPSDLRRAVKEICEVADEANLAKAKIDDAAVERDLTEVVEDVEAASLKDNEEQRSSNADEKTSKEEEYFIRAASDETVTQSLESRRGNVSNGFQGNNQRPTRKRDTRRVAKIQFEDSDDGTHREMDSHAAKKVHREWESSCTNSCSSFLEGVSEVPQGVPLTDKVLTNFASHEELDSFDNHGMFEDAENASEFCRKKIDKKQPAHFSWSKQSSRTAKYRKRSLNVLTCQKRNAAKRELDMVAVRERNSIHVEGFGDSLEKKLSKPKTVSIMDSDSPFGRLKGRDDVCSGGNEMAPDPDKHLPLLKRARARIIHEGPGQSCGKEMDEDNTREGKQRIHLRRSSVNGKAKPENDELQGPSKLSNMKTLPPKADKCRIRSGLLDGESSLPPSKRRQRALEAMTACVAEATNEVEEAEVECSMDRATHCRKVETASKATRGSGYLRNGKGFADKEGDFALIGRCIPKHNLNEKRASGQLRTENFAATPKTRKLKKMAAIYSRSRCGHDTRTAKNKPEEEVLPNHHSSFFKTKLAQYYGSNQVGKSNDVTIGNLDDLPFVSTTSRFHSEDVNRVREAYEAAKEKKQKLASKNASAPSTSMKYLLAAAQSKQAHPIPAVLFPRNPEMHRDAVLSHEAEAAQDALEGLLDNVSRAKDSIGRVTRQAVDCARFGASEQVIDIIARKLESEQSFHRRVDLFLAVDSIAQWSHNQKGTPAGVYRSLVQNALPRLLSAAAPPGNFARDNRRQCLKVLKLWLERSIFPECVVRHFIREIEFHDAERPSMNLSQRPSRTERPLDDPIREMEGMQVDEYGSNASFPLPGLVMPRMSEDDDYATGSGRTVEDHVVDEPAAALHEPVQRYPHVLEQVDGELEMEDVSPVSELEWSRHYERLAQPLPPLPSCPPPSPPPPPPSPPRDSVQCFQVYENYRFPCTT